MSWLETLESLRGHLSRAEFEDAFNDVNYLPAIEIPDGSNLDDPNALDALRLRSMAAEVFDYYGEYAKAREFVIRTAEYCEARLRSMSLTERVEDENEPEVLQQVWVALQAGLCEYRANRFDSALGLFNICDQVILMVRHPRWGTKARIKYSLGLVHREEYRLHDAIECFVASTEFAYESFVHNSKKPVEISKLNHIAIARSIGMGLASIYNQLGRYDLAIPLLMAAKAMLPTKPVEKLISTHIDLIEATLQRALPQSEEEVMNRLLICHSNFRNHSLYRARAAYSLAYEYLRRVHADLSLPLNSQDEEYIRQVKDVLQDLTFERSGNLRFPYLALLLQSELERRKDNFVKAEELAGLGMQEVSATRFPSMFLEFCAARGLARIGIGDIRGAVSDFEAGLKLSESANNRRLQSIFLLRLCECHSRAREDVDAAFYFNEFEELKKFMEVETADVRRLEEKTRAIFKRAPDLILTLKDDFDPEEVEKRFRQFLIKWARSKSKSDVEAARRLKISRQTFYNWIQDAESSTPGMNRHK